MPYANNKGTDQPAHPCSLISTFIFRCLDSIIPLLDIAKNFKTLYLVFVAEQASLSNPWSQTQKTGFLVMRLIKGVSTFWIFPVLLGGEPDKRLDKVEGQERERQENPEEVGRELWQEDYSFWAAGHLHRGSETPSRVSQTYNNLHHGHALFDGVLRDFLDDFHNLTATAIGALSQKVLEKHIFKLMNCTPKIHLGHYMYIG